MMLKKKKKRKPYHKTNPSPVFSREPITVKAEMMGGGWRPLSPPGRPPTFRFLWVEHSINLKERQQKSFHSGSIQKHRLQAWGFCLFRLAEWTTGILVTIPAMILLQRRCKCLAPSDRLQLWPFFLPWLFPAPTCLDYVIITRNYQPPGESLKAPWLLSLCFSTLPRMDTGNSEKLSFLKRAAWAPGLHTSLWCFRGAESEWEVLKG